jgi:hypothetical protein
MSPTTASAPAAKCTLRAGARLRVPLSCPRQSLSEHSARPSLQRQVTVSGSRTGTTLDSGAPLAARSRRHCHSKMAQLPTSR